MTRSQLLEAAAYVGESGVIIVCCAEPLTEAEWEIGLAAVRNNVPVGFSVERFR
jgi:hypothetical protein